jgi:hypothetical protein
MSALKVLVNNDTSRARRDRLELLTTLMEAPGFDPLYRSDLIAIPPRHRVYGWGCDVDGCGRVRTLNGFCHGHRPQWFEAQQAGSSRAAFIAAATPYQALHYPWHPLAEGGPAEGPCAAGMAKHAGAATRFRRLPGRGLP